MSAEGASQATQDQSGVVPLIINNESIVTDKTFEVNNPATGGLAHRCVGASVDDATRAAVAAKAAFPAWSKTKPFARRDVLLKAAAVMLSRKDELVGYQVLETGCDAKFAEATFMMGVSLLKDVAGRVSSIQGAVPEVLEDGQYSMVLKQPYGVVLGIAPWYVVSFNTFQDAL